MKNYYKNSAYVLGIFTGLIIVLSMQSSSVRAATSTANQPIVDLKMDLPVSVQDAYDTFKEMKISTGTINHITLSGGADWMNKVKSFWQSINDWFSRNLGVSFDKILVAIGNILVWLLELLVKLLKWTIDRISGR